MASYLTLAEFKARTVMPGADIDALEALAPGFVLARLTIESGSINARLTKGYDVPFAAPTPDIVVGWLVAIVTEQAFRRRGVDPNDPQATEYVRDADRARAELLEAANSETGLFDLPLRQDLPSSSGRSKGGPLGYSETSPYVAFDLQREAASSEDMNGRGTGG